MTEMKDPRCHGGGMEMDGWIWKSLTSVKALAVKQGGTDEVMLYETF